MAIQFNQFCISRNHPSIIKIKERVNLVRNLSSVSYNLDILSQVMTKYFSDTVNTSEFPSAMKLADVIPVFKKNERPIKKNHRPVSILPIFSKIFEKILYDQISAYFANILSKNQCGFRKGCSSQHSLVAMIEKWKKSLDSKGSLGALLTDISKAFDCIPHELMIAKLDAYRFDLKALILVFNYLHNRKQRVKINSSYSDWSDLLFGVPLGSLLCVCVCVCVLCFILKKMLILQATRMTRLRIVLVMIIKLQ